MRPPPTNLEEFTRALASVAREVGLFTLARALDGESVHGPIARDWEFIAAEQKVLKIPDAGWWAEYRDVYADTVLAVLTEAGLPEPIRTSFAEEMTDALATDRPARVGGAPSQSEPDSGEKGGAHVV